MSQRKERLTVTVDPELIEAGNRAVAAGQVDSMSAWVNEALNEKAVRERKLQALAAAIADFETDFGEITSEEIAAQRHADREAAVVVRGRKAGGQGRRSRPGKGPA